MSEDIFSLGIDIGSTTVKVAILNSSRETIFSSYRRHFASIIETLKAVLIEAKAKLGDVKIKAYITGSGGLGLSKALHIPFVQEVVAEARVIKLRSPKTNVAIELGGEDAKIIYFDHGIDERMNGICAGGTGSFIDQMASLLKTDASGLNELAKDYKVIYPIAARCGVFAKTDIQPLINDGASKNDLAKSIFKAVVNQTISGLACGKPIRGNVAFLGGPLHFLPELRKTFIETLNLGDENVFAPEDSHLYPAMGAALEDSNIETQNLSTLIGKLNSDLKLGENIKKIEPLFKDEEEYKNFKLRHSLACVKKKDISSYKGEAFLGIDAGSTTTKMALIDRDGNLLFSYYTSNEGSPIEATKKGFRKLIPLFNKDIKITQSCSTGYGEALVKAAFNLDYGEVETIAHYKAAKFFDKKVDCILDIGGQDMKCIKIKNGSVDSVLLNEACSSGCGSFIETFAKSLNKSVEEFAKEALFAKSPVDLGSRCTVFMNSNVKQAQKEGATVGDISSGLAYSVIKNALYKVIKLTSKDELGENVVVQGGTFYNDAVLRALEKILDKEVIRPDISGIMGAFGAALVAKENYDYNKIETTMMKLEDAINLTYKTHFSHCKGCNNNCILTINTFSNRKSFISGNRCERFVNNTKRREDVPNMYKWKYKRLFSYEPLSEDEATRGTIGIPRVLNIYENYPFWATFFKELGFRLVLSPESYHSIYELGIESIPSESECYPAKLVHGHIEWLIQNGIKTIFYPSIPYERNETKQANNHFNCPIVTSYPENIKNNVEDIKKFNIRFIHPFFSLTNEEIAAKELANVFEKEFNIPKNLTKNAAKDAFNELLKFKKEVEYKGKEILKWMEDTHHRGIVLAGRPYHIDPEINHGIPEMIESYGFAVLTEDAVAPLGECVLDRPLRVNDQWMYHSRLYKAAAFVRTRDDLDLVQLNSFGCGLDAVTTDEVSEILTNSNNIYTVLKIDEISNLGAARIRIRSLIAALKAREIEHNLVQVSKTSIDKVVFTKEMRKTYTILVPNMARIHFKQLEVVMRTFGYKAIVLDPVGKTPIDLGLKYVNNDACYPSLIVVGQMMEALQSGKYDLNKVALIMSQTGGGCRASNYIGFIRRALKKANMAQIPVISANLSGLEDNPGFKITLPLIYKAVQAIVYGDVLMRVTYHTRPYEKNKGETDRVFKKYEDRGLKYFASKKLNVKEYNKMLKDCINEFDNIERLNIVKPKVGIVGEILVKFSDYANNYLAATLEKEGAEAVIPDLLDFFLYSFYNNEFKAEHLGKSKFLSRISKVVIDVAEQFRKTMRKYLDESKNFVSPSRIEHTAKNVDNIVSLGNQTGEGWLLTGEMVDLIESGVSNIICTQPFGCLPNHIVGKGVIKELHARFPKANIIAIDYDSGASEVNQLNRIKMMLENAKNSLKENEKGAH